VIANAASGVRRYYAAHPMVLDLTLLAILTVAAMVTRLVLLGQLPYGVHPDEAQLATDGRKILDGELWTVYTKAVLGQPSGHAYLTLPSFLIFGWTPMAMRLPLALVGITAIPLLYLFVRQGYGRVEAFFAAALLTVSYWHLMYSRVAHWSISYGTILLAVLCCLMLGMNTQKRWWFAAAGAALGLGLYTYNVYPVAIFAVFVFLLIMTVMRYRRRDMWRWWGGSMGLFGGAALLVALPMLIYLANPNSFYWEHIRGYGDVRVTQTPEYKDGDTLEKIELIARQVETFVGAYAWDGDLDIVDGNGIRPMFDPVVVALLLAGLAFGIRERRNPVAIAAIVCLVIIPLPAVLQRGSIMRQPVGAAPYVAFFAALPLAFMWRAALQAWGEEGGRGRLAAIAVGGMAAALLVATTAITVRDYYWVWRKDDWPRYIYHAPTTTAADYMRGLPEGTFVLYYSWQTPINIEIIQFLAPDVEGSDRSYEFSDFGASIEVYDRSRPTVFLLMEEYEYLLPDIEARYPGGTVVRATRDGKLDFVAYELPAEE
jgi:4-amino-4-deoxy-L-arabinose transferase-like glycosyltransferase